ncbi:ring PHD BROMO family protein [Micromonas commoda]|uniref:Ring PHD BROMO family protein n=1 Tax=Micromonas commoda (strain RCC299 / NOUM17 / CCMP2709) TaxID=296587 RepID=C1E5I3_MICCC|nr:ring PHD BROMO family protein [Micromonas commoda]ACO63635.1 ring PHD BROMO family protein [Micromonas commoda]|eukprot:XP_002502377.1 ring PHD BROMO family protein [Micromonas commoda]
MPFCSFLYDTQLGILTINFENCTLFRAFAPVARLGQWHFHAAVLFPVLAADFQRWFKFKTENETSGETWASHGNRRTMAMYRKGSRYFAARHDGSYSLAKEVRALLRELRCGRVQPHVCALDKSDDDDLQAVECAVCLDACVDPCTLRGCPSASSHTFCLSCITRWAEVATWCPLCKLRFDAIIPPNGEPIEVQARSPGDAPRVEADDVVGMDEYGNAVTAREYIECIDAKLCEVCEGGADETQPGMSDAETLLCDGCDSAWHMACLRPPLTTIPEGDWMCPGCVKDAEEKEAEEVSIEESDEGEEAEEKENEEPSAKRTRRAELVDVRDGDEQEALTDLSDLSEEETEEESLKVLGQTLNQLEGVLQQLPEILQRRQETNEMLFRAALQRQTEATRAADFDRFRYAAQSEQSGC